MRVGPALVLLASMVALIAWTSDAGAYPWMIRHGYAGCTTCHADPSGGELLTQYGRAQGDLLLRMRYGSDTVSGQASKPEKGGAGSFDTFDEFDSESEAGKPAPKKQEPEPKAAETESGPSPTAGFLWGLIEPPEGLLLGGSYRHMTLYNGKKLSTFPMQLDLYGQLTIGRFRIGGSLGGARVKEGSPYARAAQITRNQGNEWNLISRTHWIGFDLDQNHEFTLRAGRLNLPFGLRIPEHIMWVRAATRTDRESSQQHGAALAYNGTNLRGEGMLIAGNYQINPDRYRERGYSLFVETSVTEGFAAGVSSLFTVANADRVYLEQDKTSRGAHGAFTRIRVVKPLVVMMEADALHMSRRELGYVGLLQLDLEVVQGLHLGGSGEILDQGYEKQNSGAPGIDIARARGAGQPRLGAWGSIDWFFLPHFEARFDVLSRQNEKLWLLAQLHFYL